MPTDPVAPTRMQWSRRRLLRTILAAAAFAGGGSVLSACTSAAPAPPPPTATSAPPAAKPTSAPTQAAPAATPAPATAAAKPAATAAPAVAAAAPTASGAPPELLDLKFGIAPIAAQTPIYVAGQMGFYKDEGFRNVDLTPLGNGAEAISVVASGKIDLAISTYVSALQAKEQNFDVVFVANNDNATSGKEINGRKDVHALLVRDDSPIQRPKDLEGKTVGVSSAPGILWMFVAETINKDGGDYKKVNFQEVPFPQMPDVLVNGGIDAGSLLEPFTTVALNTGKLRAIAWPYVDALPGAYLGGSVTMRSWAAAHPITAQKFSRAVQRAMDVMKDDQAARKWIIEYAKTNPDIASKMWLSVWTTKVDLASVAKQQDFMLELGMLKNKINVADLFWSTALP